VVQQAIDGRGGECLGHQLVEAGRVDVAGERDRAFLVAGVDDPVRIETRSRRATGVMAGRSVISSRSMQP
jgi:hypothetical protein